MENKIIDLLNKLGFIEYKNPKYFITVGIEMFLNKYIFTKDFEINNPDVYYALSKNSTLLISTHNKEIFYEFLLNEFKNVLRKDYIKNLLK